LRPRFFALGRGVPISGPTAEVSKNRTSRAEKKLNGAAGQMCSSRRGAGVRRGPKTKNIFRTGPHCPVPPRADQGRMWETTRPGDHGPAQGGGPIFLSQGKGPQVFRFLTRAGIVIWRNTAFLTGPAKPRRRIFRKRGTGTPNFPRQGAGECSIRAPSKQDWRQGDEGLNSTKGKKKTWPAEILGGPGSKRATQRGFKGGGGGGDHGFQRHFFYFQGAGQGLFTHRAGWAAGPFGAWTQSLQGEKGDGTGPGQKRQTWKTRRCVRNSTHFAGGGGPGARGERFFPSLNSGEIAIDVFST